MKAWPPNTSVIDASCDMTPVHSQLASYGIDTILRYGAAAAWKCITPGEAGSMQRNKLKLALIYELTARDILLGASEGAKAGLHVLTFAPSVGLVRSAGVAVYVTADFDIQRDQLSPALAYLHAFASSCPGYELGVYGSGLLCDTAFAAGIVKYRWIAQSSGYTGSSAALAGGRYELVQRMPDKVGGLDVDPDSLRVANLDIGARVPFAPIAPSAQNEVGVSGIPTLAGKPAPATAVSSTSAANVGVIAQLKQLVAAL